MSEMPKDSRIKLWQLLDLIDYNRESTTEKIQIMRPNGDGWDDVDEVTVSSSLLLPIYKAEVTTIGMPEKDVIRVSIDWDALNLYGWAERKEE